MTFTGPPADRQLIRELFDTYGDAVIRKDLETYLRCWADNCRRTGEGGECEGKEALRAHWQGVFETVEQMAFFTQPASLVVNNDHASARSYCLELMKLGDGSTRRLVGEYDDELVRVAGTWLFTHRHYRVVMAF